ncbi:hypothetical protein [Mycolicibacterium sp.]|uniref:hypothetical protein n=1 Tax=Mycolicibacterium sp. TaxID=2320850 RepID=UPI0037C67EF3
MFDGGRWWDLRTKDPALLASLGWYEVTLTDRPADTDTTTSDLTYEFADGAVAQVWTERPKTPDEIEAETEAANERTLRDGLQNVLTRAAGYQADAQAIIDDTNSNINQNPAARIKTLARAQKRAAGDIMRLARLAGGLLDSADTGSD